MVLARNAAAGRGFLYPFPSFSGQSDFVSQKSCICVTLMSQNPPVLLPRKSVFRHTLPHRRVRRQPLFRVSRKQRYNTLDFASKIVCQQGCCAPLLETQQQRDVPFAIPHFPRRCIYKLQKAACHACSENAKGSLRRCVAQTSFWAEMQKKGTVVSSAFPRSARRGRKITSRENFNIAKRGMIFSKNHPALFHILFRCLYSVEAPRLPVIQISSISSRLCQYGSIHAARSFRHLR